MTDPGFFASVMQSGPETAKQMLRRLGLDKDRVCPPHSWHAAGTVNGRRVESCQLCGLAKTSSER